MQKYIVSFLIATLFLLSNTMAAKLPRGFIHEHDEIVYIFYNIAPELSMHDLLTRENASPVDHTQRKPFQEKIEAMSGPPDLPPDPGQFPVPGGLLVMFAFAGTYTAWRYRKKNKINKL